MINRRRRYSAGSAGRQAISVQASGQRCFVARRIACCGWLMSVVLLCGCVGTSAPSGAGRGEAAGVSPSVRGYKVGKPYQIKGVWYYPKVDYEYAEVGVASWYGPGFDGRKTANGETYDMNDLTAAHRTLPMPSVVRVTNLDNGRSLKLRVNDRGPFYGDRIIDVSRRAAQMLGFYMAGTTRVSVEIMADESRQLAAALGVPMEALPNAPARTAPTEVAAAAPSDASPAYEPSSSTSYPERYAEVPTPAVDAADSAAAVAETPLLYSDASPSAATDPALPEQLRTYAAASAREVYPSYLPAADDDTGGHTNIYVQAGAFADAGRADSARRRLAPLGPVVMSSSRVNGRDLLRVRVGPLASDAEAERVLAWVSGAGFPDCRLIIE
jgi:rare lipoprotein A